MGKVLIVDDEEAYCVYLARALLHEGHLVQTALSGHQGIELGTQFLPHVLIADWMLMNDHDGLDVAEALRRKNPDLKTIIITGYLSARLRREVQEANLFGFLEKPFELDDLLATVHDALGEPEERNNGTTKQYG